MIQDAGTYAGKTPVSQGTVEHGTVSRAIVFEQAMAQQYLGYPDVLNGDKRGRFWRQMSSILTV